MLDIAAAMGAKLILVVEDNPVDRLLFEDSLSAVYQLDTAADGETALSRLDSPSLPAVDLLLLDLKLPRRFGREDTKEEGYRVIQHLRQQAGKRSPEIVVVSDYLTAEDWPRLEKLGVRYVLPKRVTDEQLYATVADALRLAA
jgi:CheY-like chemotaxis protein